MGKFLWAIPIVVIIALFSSLLESFFILPSHIVEILGNKTIKKSIEENDKFKKSLQSKIFHKLQKRYRPLLEMVLLRPYISLIIVLSAFIISIGLARKIGYKMSSAGMPSFHILTEANEDVSLKEMSRRMERFENIIKSLSKKEVSGFVTRVGIQKPDMMDPFYKRGKNYSQLTAYLTPLNTRDRSDKEIMNSLLEKLRKENAVHQLFKTVNVKQEHSGPPIGSPVELKIKGERFETILEIVGKIKSKLSTIKGVHEIKDNHIKGKEIYYVRINETIAARAGVSSERIAHTLTANFEGAVASTIKEGQEEIKIRIIYPQKLREKLNSLRKVFIKNRIGNLVSINTLAFYEKRNGIAAINHHNKDRVIYVQAEIDPSINTPAMVNDRIMKYGRDIMKDYPGYSLNSGGEIEDTKEVRTDMVFAVGFAVIGIVIILLLLFDNFKHIRVVFSAVPLSFIGVVIAFSINKIFQPDLHFTFVANMGIIALSGVVLNDSIVLISAINNLIKKGTSIKDAVILGSMSRMRPIILTSVTTVLGLFPIAYGIGGRDPFLEPMALALSWGIVFATIITLLVIPVLYIVFEERSYVFKNGIIKVFQNIRSIRANLDNKQSILKQKTATISMRIWSYFYDNYVTKILFLIWSIIYVLIFIPDVSGNVSFDPHGEGLVISGTQVTQSQIIIFLVGILIISITWRLVTAFLESKYNKLLNNTTLSRNSLRIKIIGTNGESIGFIKSLTRSIFRVFPLSFVTLISMELSKDGRGIHDKLFGTYVVQVYEDNNEN